MADHTLRDGFLTSLAVNQCSIDAQNVYVRLQLVADVAGREQIEPGLVARLYPLGGAPFDLFGLLSEMKLRKLLVRYHFDGSEYLQIMKRQVQSNVRRSKFPWVDGSYGFTVVPVETANGKRLMCSTSLCEEPVEQSLALVVASADKPTTKATRLPKTWQLPEQWRQWALDFLATRPNGKGVDVQLEADTFRDFWSSLPDTNKAKKLDWEATWHNWIRNTVKWTKSTRREAPSLQNQFASRLAKYEAEARR